MADPKTSIEVAKSRQKVSAYLLAAMAIEVDIQDRRGLKHEWNSIDTKVREDILTTWEEIIQRCVEVQ